MSMMPYTAVMNSLLQSLNPPTVGQLTNPLQGAMGANRANSQRGQSILKLLDAAGQTAMADNQTDYQNHMASNRQSMIDRGLGNTTVLDNINQEAADQLAYANNRVRENSAGDMARMAASFSTPGPNMADLGANLKPSMSGRIIQGPNTGFGDAWRPFGV